MKIVDKISTDYLSSESQLSFSINLLQLQLFLLKMNSLGKLSRLIYHKLILKGRFVKKFFLFIIALTSWSVNAETVYVTDSWRFTMRSQESNRSKIIKMLSPGTALTVIKKNKKTGYTKVKIKDGTEGYILTLHTKDKPSYRWYLKLANKKLETLKQENTIIKSELTSLKGDNSKTSMINSTLTHERDKIRVELANIQKTAANAVQLKQQRDQLQERVVTVERELQQIKRENQALEDNSNQDWFLYGGILSFVGVFLGLLLPKISWHRKTSNWDTF
jgi:SH3 domain protein